MNNTMDKTAFVKGFLKTAEESGVEMDRISLNKFANECYYSICKTAGLEDLAGNFAGSTFGLLSNPGHIIGPYLAAQALGAGLGSSYTPQSNKELEEEMAYTEDPSLSKALKHIFLPGYSGYRAAKANRLEHAYQKYRDDRRAQSSKALAQQPSE